MFAVGLAFVLAACVDRHVEIRDRRSIRSCGSHGPHCGVDVSGTVERPDGTPYEPVVVALLGGNAGSGDQRFFVTRERGAFRLFTYGMCTAKHPVLVVAETDERVLCALPADRFGFSADGIRIVMNDHGKCDLRMPEAPLGQAEAAREGRAPGATPEGAGKQDARESP
jgi:hypothetical protein